MRSGVTLGSCHCFNPQPKSSLYDLHTMFGSLFAMWMGYVPILNKKSRNSRHTELPSRPNIAVGTGKFAFFLQCNSDGF